MEDNVEFPVHLQLVNPTVNADKFYRVTLHKSSVQRWWGRNGTSGQMKEETFQNDAKALEAAKKLVAQKMKKGYKRVNTVDVPVTGGKDFYQFEYWVGDGIDGKKTGWYPYDQTASGHLSLMLKQDLKEVRRIKSGHFEYYVDFQILQQENVETNTRRRIRFNQS